MGAVKARYLIVSGPAASGKTVLAYGLADVADAFKAHTVESRMMVMSGGGARSPLVRQIMADTTGLTVALPRTQEPVLLGAAMLGAVACGAFASVRDAMASMSAIGLRSGPPAPGIADFHRAKRRVHESMRKAECEGREAMRGI